MPVASRAGSAWRELDRELARWRDRGRTPCAWWRDDDARSPGPALSRLLGLAHRFSVPLALAVIPDGLDTVLGGALRSAPGVSVLQHGWAHRNHAPPGDKKRELGAGRGLAVVLHELERGQARLRACFGARLRPVLVPPWNRIDAGVTAALAARGFAALSTFGPRREARAAPGVEQVNTHVDLVDWRRRRFVGEEQALRALRQHLTARRTGAADASEPTGLLTHHLVHDDACWDFLARLLEHTRERGSLRWTAPDWTGPSPARSRAPGPGAGRG